MFIIRENRDFLKCTIKNFIKEKQNFKLKRILVLFSSQYFMFKGDKTV